MSIETLLVILLVWAVAGLLTAIAFGKAVQTGDMSSREEPLASAAAGVKYFRRNKRKEGRPTDSVQPRSAANKRATG